jgi:hypothetical protein
VTGLNSGGRYVFTSMANGVSKTTMRVPECKARSQDVNDVQPDSRVVHDATKRKARSSKPNRFVLYKNAGMIESVTGLDSGGAD